MSSYIAPSLVNIKSRDLQYKQHYCFRRRSLLTSQLFVRLEQ